MPFSVPDHSTADDPRLLAQVEQAIASGVRSLRFDSELEHRYEADTHQQRRQFLTTIGIIGGLVYNVFMFSDWLTLHDMFAYVALGRVCLITPMIIGLLLLLQRLKSRWALETVAAMGTVVSSLMPLVVMIYSDSPYRMHFQLGMVLIMVYCTMIQQMPLRYAAWAMLCMVVIQLVTTYLAHFADFIIWQSNALLFVSTAALLLVATYFMERGKRFSYLFSLRGYLLQRQLGHMARTDSLTGLYNRHYQGEVMAALWEQARTAPTTVAVILLDIDHFKAYNDSYGHLQGDVCLKRLSEVIRRTAQEAGALAFRFGGEEILLLLVDAHVGQAEALAGALQTGVAGLQIAHPVLGADARVTVSLGIAAAVVPHVDANALIGMADSALYDAKHAGRNCARLAQAESASSLTALVGAG